MRVSRVLGRFLSLTDVVMILLGVLVISVGTTPQNQAVPLPVPTEIPESGVDENAFNIVFLIASEEGKFFFLDSQKKEKIEVRTNTPVDIENIFKKKEMGQKKIKSRIVVLLIDDVFWFTKWNEKKRNDLRKIWNTTPLVFIDNFKFKE